MFCVIVIELFFIWPIERLRKKKISVVLNCAKIEEKKIESMVKILNTSSNNNLFFNSEQYNDCSSFLMKAGKWLKSG